MNVISATIYIFNIWSDLSKFTQDLSGLVETWVYEQQASWSITNKIVLINHKLISKCSEEVMAEIQSPEVFSMEKKVFTSTFYSHILEGIKKTEGLA